MFRTTVTALIALLFYAGASFAEPRFIDSAVAIVEDDVITTRELIDEVRNIRRELRESGRPMPAANQLNRQVLELMIVKSIMLQEAENRGVNITDTQLNSALQRIAQRNDLTLERFRLALLDSGIDYNEFRENIREELAINQIKTSYARQNVEVSDQEVDDFIRRNQGLGASFEYRLSHILIALPDGASSDRVSAARQQIEELRSRILAGEDFARLANEFSDGGNAIRGGDLGWRSLAETPSLFADLLPQMQPGDVSPVTRSASGFHIIQLAEQRNSDQVIASQTRARHILIKPDEVTSPAQARQKLESLRQRIVDGEDFAELAREHSQDPGSGGLGGDLGWFAKGVMVPEFQAVVDVTAIDELSPIFESPFGWHLLQVTGRREVDETEENQRAKIREQLQEQKRTEVLELWQRRLRDQAYVKILDA